MTKKFIHYKKMFCCIVLFLFLLSFTSFAGTLNFIDDAFDSHSINTLPDEWHIMNPGNSVIISDDYSHSGNQSLFLDGNSGYAVNIYQLTDPSAQNYDEIVIESYIYPNSERESGSISLYNSSANEYLGRITLLNNKIYYSTTGHDNNDLVELQDYTVGNWYHVKLIHNFNTKTYDIIIDNNLIASDVAMSSNESFNSIMLASGNSTGSNEIYFDDLKIYTFVDDTAPVVSPGNTNRINDLEGSITFTSNEAGKYYLSVVEKDAPEPIIDTSTSGISCDTTEQTHLFNTLTPGEKDVYIVVKDSAGNVSDPVKMTINLPVVEVSRDIEVDTTWVNTNIYKIVDDIHLRSDLTINPGTIIKFNGRHRMIVYANFEALGTEDQPIHITSIKDDSVGGDTNGDGNASQASPGDWSSINFYNDAQGILNHTYLNYGGGTWGGHSSYNYIVSAYPETIALEFNDSKLMNSHKYGIRLDNTNCLILNDTDFENNLVAGIHLNNSSATINGGNFTNNSEYGVHIKADDDYTNPLPTITNTNFQGNGSYGIYLHPEALGTSIQNVTVTNNTIGVSEGSLSRDTILDNPLTYSITERVSVRSTLALRPGTIIKFTGRYPMTVYGSLEALGTEDQPIHITSINDDSIGGDTNGDGNAIQASPGDWSNIIFYNDSQGIFNHTYLNYGGGSWGGWGDINYIISAYPETSALEFNHSKLMNSLKFGIRLEDAHYLTINDTDFENNSIAGLHLTNSSAIINGGNFTNNVEYGIYIRADDDYLGDLPSISNVNFANNGRSIFLEAQAAGTSILNCSMPSDAIEIDGGWLKRDAVLSSDATYYLEDDITTDHQLTINPGIVIKAFRGGAFGVTDNGQLLIQGTESSPVTFTSFRDNTVGEDISDGTEPAPGNYRGIIISNTGEANIHYLEMNYGGYRNTSSQWWYGDSIRKNDGGTLLIDDSTISNSARNAFSLYGNGTTTINNTIINNSELNGLYIDDHEATINNTVINANNEYGINIAPTEKPIHIESCSINDNTSGQIILGGLVPNLTIIDTPVEGVDASISPGTVDSTTKISVNKKHNANTLMLRINNTTIEIPDVLADPPTEGTIINPYISGENIFGVDLDNNKYIEVYEVNPNNQILGFKRFTVTVEDINYTTYQVTYDENGGELPANPVSDSVIAGESVESLPTPPTKSHYIFNGWWTLDGTDDQWGNAFDTNTIINNDLTVYAKWSPEIYNVSFKDTYDTTIPNQLVPYNEKAIKPTAPSRTGFIFNRWEHMGDLFSFETTPIIGTTELFATWTRNIYPVYFVNTYDTAIDDQNIPYEGYATKPEDPERTGYTFNGWLYEDAPFDFVTDQITGETTLEADWQLISTGTGGSASGNSGSTSPSPENEIEAVTDRYRILKNETLSLTTNDLMVNDENAETFETVEPGDHGSVTLADNNITFTPTNDFVGRGYFYYTIRNDDSEDRGLVLITIEDTEEITPEEVPLSNDDPDAFILKEPLKAVAHKINHEKSYILGYPDGTFRPNQPITRAEVVTIFTRILEMDLTTLGDPLYEDVNLEDWYYDTIQSVSSLNIFNGYEDGTFKPNENMTHAEIASAFVQYWESLGLTLDSTGENYPDIEGHWAEEKINKFYNAGVTVVFSDGTFRPDAYTTRGELVFIVNQILGRENTLPEEPTFNDITEHWSYGFIEAATNQTLSD